MRIGRIEIDRPLCLAPMEDVTDPPYRRLCREEGADLLYTEFAHCEAVTRNVTSECRKLYVDETEHPIGVQLYGSTESTMERATAMAAEAGADFIDLNAGCWVKKIAKRGDGAGLLRDLKKFASVVRAVMRGTSLPVTVKTRLGWDADNIVILDVARIVQDLGVSALTVHLRTRAQGYTGCADWSWIEKIRAACAIPFIANGDIVTPQDAKACLDLGADGVMIGRGAIARPWVFRHMRHYLNTGELLPEPGLNERVEICLRHLAMHAEYRGVPRGIFSFRRNYAGYLKGVPHIAQLRAELMTMESVEPIVARLNRFMEEYREWRDMPTADQGGA
jgi:tRNA-dihydrouridine synthase B